MKLSEHVNELRNRIEAAFDKYLAINGIGVKQSSAPAGDDKRGKWQRFDAMLRSHQGETGDFASARLKLLDELTFTLFNRFAAIKVMEAASMFPPIMTRMVEHGGRSFGHKAWLEINPDMRGEDLEGIREYIKQAFDELGETLPLYHKSYPYAFLPDSHSLNEIIDAFNAVEKDAQVGADIWLSDDVLGWLYESYNEVKKKEFKESKAKTEYDKVSLQSQVYTPRWVVQFLVENSLGKLYLEMYPGSAIKNKHKIANAPTKQERESKPLREIKLIDPACGSGNFLLFAFDFFYELYIDQIENHGAEYEENEISKLIIENNLHGVDLDDRAVQIAQLGLYIKARKKNRRVKDLKFKVVSSDFYLPEYDEVRSIFEAGANLDQSQKELLADIWSDLKFSYKFGSLIQLDARFKARLQKLVAKREQTNGRLFSDEEICSPPKSPEPIQRELYVEQAIIEEKEFISEFFKKLKSTVEQYARSQGSSFLTDKTRDAIVFLELLTNSYDVATANPPYTDSSDFGPDLKKFIEDNYKKPFGFHTNLYATFIKRCCDYVSEVGKVAMVHPPTFMYIKTFEDVRKFIIEKTHISFFVEWGYLGMFNPSARVDSALYILEKGNNKKKDSCFIKLNHLYETKRYSALFEAYQCFLNNEKHDLFYQIPQEKLKIIKSWPFIYWISDDFRQKFAADSVKDILKNCQGLATADNNRFLRFWWELGANIMNVKPSDWPFYAKGGPFKKWSGNLWLRVNWRNNGQEIRDFTDEKGKQRSRPQNENVYFMEGITYSASGSKGPSYRLLPSGCIFDVGGSSIFPIKKFHDNNYILGFFNTKFANYIIECLNPTVNKQVGDIERIPFVIPSKLDLAFISKLSGKNVCITNRALTFSIFEKQYVESPLYKNRSTDLQLSIKTFLCWENYLMAQVLINEAIINHRVLDIYSLTENDRIMVLAKEGESIGNLSVLAEARSAYLAESEATKEFPLDDIKDFIENLPVKEFSAEEREAVEKEFPSLYQNNNDLEEFCIRHQINPINVWYWFKQSKVIPEQRMHTIAMEFLADMIREILMEDEDGIVPLIPNSGETTLLERIEAKFIEKGFSMAQYSSFDSVLGRSINDYLNKCFFAELSDHLNLFMYLPKTPFIWHLSSGPEQGFDCYVIIYKWSRDKLMRLRSVYIEHRERALKNRQSDIADKNTAEAQNEKDRIFKQLKEIEAFKKKIDELLAEGYNPILDDGVGKNIAPLQKKGMITYEVLNPGQLKKYLNADW